MDGAASSVQFADGVVIQGGTLTTANNGVLGSASGNTVTLDGRANALAIGAGGTYTVNDNSTTNILGTINNLGTVLLNSTGNPTFLTVPSEESATLTGGGTVTMSASANSINGPALDNSGNTIQDLAALNIVAFTQDSGAIQIAASGAATAATFAVNGGTAQVDGALNASSGVSVASGATFSGTGTISGNLAVNGAVQPGDIPNPGMLTISGNGAGNYTQGSSGDYNALIGGTNPGTQYSQVNLTGAANLSGTLNVSLIDEFTPAVGNQFTVLTAGSVTGQFTVTNLQSLPAGLSWKVTSNPASVVLSVVAIAPTLVSIAVTSCSGSFPQGTQVALTATAASGSNFTSFAGGGCATVSPCTVTLNAATTVTATFEAANTPTFTPVPGSGLTATGNPGDTFEFPLQLTGPPGQTIILSCSPDPTATSITCAVAPATVTLNAKGTTGTFIQVSSFCSWNAPRPGPRNPIPGNWLMVLGGLALIGCAFAARRRGLAFALPIASLALLMISVVGCSNGPAGPAGRTPPGTYHLTIPAKAQSGITGQVVLTLIIK